MGSRMTAVTQEERRADVVILTAIKLELDAVRKVEAGAVAGSSWEEAPGPSGLPVAYRRFAGKGDRPLRVAVALAPDMGATAVVNTLLPLVAALRPRCVAMCGVCAGRRGKVALGDVIAADRVYYHDTGKQLPGRVEQDLTTYKLRDDWKVALERMDPVALFGGEAWFLARPLTTEWREQRVLVNLGNGDAEPWAAVDPTMTTGEWQEILAGLKERKLVAASGRTLTAAGRRFVDELRFAQMGEPPDVSPAGLPHPLRLHVAPIGSGARVIEDEQIWMFVSEAMRKTLGVEMEAAAIGELAHRQRQHALDWVVMKGVMDFADHGRDDHFKQYAARVAAECLLRFLREHVATEPAAELEDVRETKLAPLTVRPPTMKHTILFLAANPIGTDPRALDREARAIQEELERSGFRDCFELETRWAVEPLDLLRELRKLKPTVVHFSGHGAAARQLGSAPHRDIVGGPGHDGDRPRHGLYFQGSDGQPQVVSTEALEQTFGAAGASVKLVVLSACYSEAQARALLPHVGCVVGMSGSIHEAAARSFAIGFYGGLGERASVAAAYKQGCAAISLQGLQDSDRPQLAVRAGVDATQLVLAADPS
jgi:nucleoside phosphorylase